MTTIGEYYGLKEYEEIEWLLRIRGLLFGAKNDFEAVDKIFFDQTGLMRARILMYAKTYKLLMDTLKAIGPMSNNKNANEIS